jgi:hypothetical protein
MKVGSLERQLYCKNIRSFQDKTDMSCIHLPLLDIHHMNQSALTSFLLDLQGIDKASAELMASRGLNQASTSAST